MVTHSLLCMGLDLSHGVRQLGRPRTAAAACFVTKILAVLEHGSFASVGPNTFLLKEG